MSGRWKGGRRKRRFKKSGANGETGLNGLKSNSTFRKIERQISQEEGAAPMQG